MAKLLAKQIKKAFSGWSLEHYMLDSAITTGASMAAKPLLGMSTGATIIFAACVFIAIPAGLLVWRKEKRGPATSMADLCDDLAANAKSVFDQEAAKDWCTDVHVALLLAGASSHIPLFQNITAPIFKEKPSEELISTTLNRAAILLRAVAVGTRRAAASSLAVGEGVLRDIRALYDEVISTAKSEWSVDEAKAWAERASRILFSVGEQMRAYELMHMTRPLSGVSPNVNQIMQQAVDYMRSQRAMLAESQVST